MSDYYYIGSAKIIKGTRVVQVKSTNIPIHEGNIVMLRAGGEKLFAEVISSAFISEGSDAEAVFESLGNVYELDAIYRMAWEKEEEEDA